MHKRLPRPDELLVERQKIADYLLCADHPDGASKAKFFTSFGFSLDEWEILKDALLRHGRERDVVSEAVTDYGTKFVVRCTLVTPDGRNPCVNGVWIVEDGSAPRLVTAYPYAS